jgi:hypothetical protein
MGNLCHYEAHLSVETLFDCSARFQLTKIARTYAQHAFMLLNIRMFCDMLQSRDTKLVRFAGKVREDHRKVCTKKEKFGTMETEEASKVENCVHTL